MVRKIDREYENPIDDIIIDFTEKVNPYYHNLDLTPNHLTIFSLIFGLSSAYLLFNQHNILAGCAWFISYYFDCADGSYARQYNMITEFGDYLDHICDIIKVLVLFSVMFYLNKKTACILLVFFLVLLILMCTHLGCQEQISRANKNNYNNGIENDDSNSNGQSDNNNDKDNNEPVLKGFMAMCPNQNWIHDTKYLGCGTFNLLLAFAIIFFPHIPNEF